MHLLKATLIIFAGIALLFFVTQGNRVRVMYDSVHSIGQRFGQSLPAGNDLSVESGSHQVVRIEPASYYTLPDRLPASLRENFATVPRVQAMRRERLVIVGIISLCAMIAFVIAHHGRRESEQLHMRELLTPLRPGMSASRTSMFLILASLVACGSFVFYRVFLTGVDDALIARSTEGAMGSSSSHILGNSTLSMSLPTLVLLYLGFVLLLLPVFIALASRCMGVPSATSWRATLRRANLASDERLVHRLSTGLAWCLYGMLTVSLLTAPWSTTLFGLIWTS